MNDRIEYKAISLNTDGMDPYEGEPSATPIEAYKSLEEKWDLSSRDLTRIILKKRIVREEAWEEVTP